MTTNGESTTAGAAATAGAGAGAAATDAVTVTATVGPASAAEPAAPAASAATAEPAPSAASAATAEPTATAAPYKPVPVAFFVFEGLIGASYDVVKSYTYGWVVLAVAAVVNIALARTVLRGRLKMARAMLKARRTRKLAAGLIALRVGVHLAFGAVGVHATSPAAHVAFAAGMCAATVCLLAFDQKVMLRALNAEAPPTVHGPAAAAS